MSIRSYNKWISHIYGTKAIETDTRRIYVYPDDKIVAVAYTDDGMTLTIQRDSTHIDGVHEHHSKRNETYHIKREEIIKVKYDQF